MDAKSTEVYYDKLEIKNPDNFGKKDKHGLAELEKEDESVKYDVYFKQAKEEPSKLEQCQVINLEDSSLRMQEEKDYPEFRKMPTVDNVEDL